MIAVPPNSVRTLSWEEAALHQVESIRAALLRGEADENSLQEFELLLECWMNESAGMEPTTRTRFLEGILKSIREAERVGKHWIREAIPQLGDLARIQAMKKAYKSSRFIDWILWPEIRR